MKKINKQQALKLISESPHQLQIKGEALIDGNAEQKQYQLSAEELAKQIEAQFNEIEQTGKKLVISLSYLGRALVTNHQCEFYLVDMPGYSVSPISV